MEHRETKTNQTKQSSGWKWWVAFGIVFSLVLLVWSYLNYLCVINIGSNNKEINWLLNLFYGDQCKAISTSINNTGQDRDQQRLSLNGTTIELTDGGSIDLNLAFDQTNLVGVPGPAGINGATGMNGSPGANGATGPTGLAGAPGPAGVVTAQNGVVLSGTDLEWGTNPLLHNTDTPLSGYNATFSGIGNVVIGSTTPAASAQLTLTGGLDAEGHSAIGNSGAINGGLLFGATGDIALDVEEIFSGSINDFTRGITSFIQADENIAPSTVATIMGVESEAATSASSLADYEGLVIGVSGQATHNGSGIATETRGVSGVSSLGGSGTIDVAYGVYGANSVIGSGTVFSSIALFGGRTSVVGPGTVVNNYGLFLADQSGVGLNNYNLYSAGASSFNEFEGDVDVQGHLTTHNHTQSAIDPVSQGTTPAFGAIEPYVVGRYAYIAVCGSGLRIVDLSDPNNPIPVGSIGGLGCSISVQVAGKYAYITGLVTGTLRVIDISNPAAPTLVSTLAHPNLAGAQQVRVAGQYAYVAGSTTGSVVVINISNPAAPTVSAVLTHPNLAGARALTISGSNLYASGATAARLNVIDITNPTTPTLVGSTPSLPLGGGLGQIASIRVVGRYAYVACLQNAGTTPGGSNAFSVVDVSNNSSPTYLTSIFGTAPGTGTTFHNPVGVYDAGRYTYMVSTENGAVGQLTVIDTSNPLTPIQVAQVENTDLSAAQALFISGRYAYTTSYGNGLVTIALTGSDLTTATIGNVNSSYMNVFQDFNVSGRAFVGTSLNVGEGGIFTNGAFSVDDNANVTGNLVVNGNVGIGNTSPAVSLHVGNNTVADGTNLLRLEDTNSVCDFNANAGGPACGSDETLKKNIVDLDISALEKINALRVVQYNWQTDEDGAPLQTGFIAQEVAEVFPDLVKDGTWTDGSTKKFLTQGQLMPYLVKAIQEQNDKIDELTNDEVLSVRVLSILADAKAVSIAGDLNIGGDIYIGGAVKLGKDSAGEATIKEGTEEIRVNFDKPYPTKPIVTVSSENLGDGYDYTITNKDERGFTIRIYKGATKDIIFNWIAVQKGEIK